MKIAIDEQLCISSGQCVLTADDVFDQRDEDGVAVLLDTEPEGELAERARQAAVLCPAQAIRLVE